MARTNLSDYSIAGDTVVRNLNVGDGTSGAHYVKVSTASVTDPISAYVEVNAANQVIGILTAYYDTFPSVVGAVRIESNANSYPIEFLIGGTQKAEVNINGFEATGTITATGTYNVELSGSAGQIGVVGGNLIVRSSTTNGNSGLTILPNGTSSFSYFAAYSDSNPGVNDSTSLTTAVQDGYVIFTANSSGAIATPYIGFYVNNDSNNIGYTYHQVIGNEYIVGHGVGEESVVAGVYNTTVRIVSMGDTVYDVVSQVQFNTTDDDNIETSTTKTSLIKSWYDYSETAWYFDIDASSLDAIRIYNPIVVFPTTGQRIRGDMNAVAHADRLLFQNSTVDAPTRFGVLPNGTGSGATVSVYEDSDPDNSSNTQMLVTSSASILRASKQGTGSYLPLTFEVNNAERVRLDTSGNLAIGTSTYPTTSVVHTYMVGGGVYASDGQHLSFAENVYYNSGWKYNESQPGGIYQITTGQHNWYTAASGTAGDAVTLSLRMRIDNSGRVGIGAIPETWDTLDAVMDFGPYGAMFNSGQTVGITSNLYFASGTFKAKNTNTSSYLTVSARNLEFVSAASATADTTPTFTGELTVDGALGSIGLARGAIPSSAFGHVAIPGQSVFCTTSDTMNIVCNAHYAGSWKYTATDFATFLQLNDGKINMLNAASGTAGNTITWHQNLQIDKDGISMGTGTADYVTKTAHITMKSDSNTLFGIHVLGYGNVTSTTLVGTMHGGTYASPTASPAGRMIGMLARSFDGTNYSNTAAVQLETEATVATTDHPTMITFAVTPDNSATRAEQMRLTSAGYLLIGYTTSNGAYRLQVNSQIYATNATIATSDARYKERVVSITNGLDVINELNPVSFFWKKHPIHNFESAECAGFLAQEVEEVLRKRNLGIVDSIIKRNKVRTNPHKPKDPDNPGVDNADPIFEEFLGMTETSLIPLIVSAIQELSKKVDKLK